MADLTANRQRPYSGMTPAKCRRLPLAGYTAYGAGNTAFTVYKGALVACDVSDTDGYYANADSAVTWVAGDIFGGVALERVDVTSSHTANGSLYITVATDGVWGFPVASIAQTDIGAPCYVVDDGQVPQTSSTDALWIGTIVGVDATYVYVDISRAAGMPNSAT